MPIGVTTIKYKKANIIGLTILLNKMPNQNHAIFGYLKILGTVKVKKKKKIEIIKKNKLISLLCKIGYIDKIIKKVPKTYPKPFSLPGFIFSLFTFSNTTINIIKLYINIYVSY